MKKRILVLCVITFGLFITGCGQSTATSQSSSLLGEITVSCYDTMFYKEPMEKAAKVFEAKNPGTKINVETFAAMPVMKTLENGITVSTRDNEEQEIMDYINKINTELMSGQGPDLMAMDVLPYNKYVDANQIEDLQFYMDEDPNFNILDYRKNILDAVKYHEGQYLMPLDYTFDYLSYDTSLFTEEEQEKLRNKGKYTYDQLIKEGVVPFNRINKSTTEFIKMFQATADAEAFSNFFDMDYETYIDVENKKVNLTDGRFSNILKSVKEYGNKNYLKPNSESSEFTMEDFEKMQNEQIFYKIKPSFSLLDDTIKKIGLEHSNSFNVLLGDDTHDEILGLLSNKDGDINFGYTQAFSINSNSNNKDLAWAFLKFLMSVENQSNQSMFSSGLSINNIARSEKAKLDILEMTSADDTVDINTPFTEKQQEVYDAYIHSIETFSDALNYAPVMDSNIDIMIAREIEDYFSESKTAEEVANTLQGKIELYLNE